MADLHEVLRRREVSIVDLIGEYECLKSGASKSGRKDYVVIMAAEVLYRLSWSGVDLSCLPPSYEELYKFSGIAQLIEQEADNVTKARRTLAKVEAWDDNHAEAEAHRAHQRAVRSYVDQAELFGSGLARARELREQVLAMPFSAVMASADLETRARLLVLQSEMLSCVDLAVSELTDRLGQPPLVMTGAEYRRHLAVECVRVIKEADQRGGREGEVRSALEFLQTFALVLHPAS